MAKNLADCCIQYVLAQQITTCVVPQMMLGQVTQTCFHEQRSQHSSMEVLVGVSIPCGITKD